jgi:hypothetical protein
MEISPLSRSPEETMTHSARSPFEVVTRITNVVSQYVNFSSCEELFSNVQWFFEGLFACIYYEVYSPYMLGTVRGRSLHIE